MTTNAPTAPRFLESFAARREVRARRRRFQRDLAVYRTDAEVDELLTMLRHHEGPDADLMRDQLVRNRLDYSVAQRPIFIAG